MAASANFDGKPIDIPATDTPASTRLSHNVQTHLETKFSKLIGSIGSKGG